MLLWLWLWPAAVADLTPKLGTSICHKCGPKKKKEEKKKKKGNLRLYGGYNTCYNPRKKFKGSKNNTQKVLKYLTCVLIRL